ncbi:RagB/SusD family nutrient uptake outer membrane protein [Bacteroides sp. 214]|uniref:RagB/SusD family nutrient uptake outer membrane protein n=1 Tax=Bacteroides sp. 214 TaxID=2302935 RepID=UPI0013D1A2B1|nr:RagB/SusD family nutrient uptake outer membrane protein [Bacteroides sp. 214]NDW11437.1 RagB/SusD family nutrient uptake outer membrane protein [Bacteroides sp. 214]
MKTRIKILTAIFASICLFTACVDADLEEVLDYENHYQTIADADNAILGLYGEFMKLAEHVVVLNELRGDLMDVTYNSSKDLQEINLSAPSKGNKYADPTLFYSIIQNCNDLLYNMDEMLKTHKMTNEDYAERYSDVAALRCWVYLQLGMHFGEVAYVTDPLITIDDVTEAAKLPTIKFDDLLDKLIDCMEKLPTLDPYLNSPLVKYTLDGYSLKNFFVNKYLLAGDLYLWRGGSQADFVNAATMYRVVLATDEDHTDASSNNNMYKLRTWPWNDSNEPIFQVTYFRYMDYDINSYRNTWLDMFQLAAENSKANQELIWTISYDKAFEPTYPFINLFANYGRGTYQLKPSQYAIDKLWEAQVQQNGFVFDGRGRESSFKMVNGEYIVQKYLYNYDSTKPFEQSGKWFLYRAGLLHLRYAEAANRAGYPKLAYALLNKGIKNAYTWEGALLAEQSQSGWAPGNYYPEPFYFDARQSDQPYYRRPWRDNGGVRGRCMLEPVEFPETATTTNDSILFLEKMLIREAALETGFEGHRWGDLTRVARRMNKEGRDGNAYLIENLSGKYELSGIPMPDFSTQEKWYLPFKK